MYINELAGLTGLTKKAIRFYESRGLLEVKRMENGYRYYDETHLERLKEIKMLRVVGFSVSDISLLFEKVVSKEALIAKRKKELENEYGRFSTQLLSFNEIITSYQKHEFDIGTEFFEDGRQIISNPDDRFAVGLDFGTTDIGVAVYSVMSHKQIDSYTVPCEAKVTSSHPAFEEQDPEKIRETALSLVSFLFGRYKPIISIGITGQMHGILYLDAEGRAVSPFVNWQDKRGDLPAPNGRSYADTLGVPTGYGMCTHYYNALNGLIPENAATFCNICDYIVVSLTGRRRPLMHTSMAQSLGCFDIEKKSFDTPKWMLPLGNMALPDVTDEYALAGEYEGAKVSVAIGDNQAGFLALMEKEPNGVMINFETGSQICTRSASTSCSPHLEVRPLVKDEYIVCGSALSGGRSYAHLERFFRELRGVDAPQYGMMDQIAMKAYREGVRPLAVDTAFYGRRADPSAKGSITGIDGENFTPEAMILGFVYGIAGELYSFYQEMMAEKSSMVLCGKDVQKIPILQLILADMFGMPLHLSNLQEEAAVGAILFALRAAERE